MTGGSLLVTAGVCCLVALPLTAASGPGQQISSDAGLRASVSADGSYQVTAGGWLFRGSIGQTLQNIAVSWDSDGVGAWTQIGFEYGPGRSSAIRLYNGSPLVLFSTRAAA